MKKILVATMATAISVSGLLGCGGTTTNVNVNTNRTATNANTSGGNSMMNNGNMMMNNANMSNMGNSTSSTGDKSFMTEAAQGGMAEVKMGELAATKAQMPEVKAFAQRMVVDHGKANTELKDLAAKKSVTLPTDVNAEQKAMYDKLAKLSGAEFDKEYVTMMVADHEKDVSAFQKEADGGTDADTKAFAAKTLPTLKSHLDSIKTIHGKMK